MVTRSPLATMAAKPQDKVAKRAKAQAYGIVVHTTGSGVPSRAEQRKEDPLTTAVRIYCTPDYTDPKTGKTAFTNFAHYVIAYDGRIVQIADELIRARHVGFAEERPFYLDGSWKQKVSAKTLALWTAKWAGWESPAHLFPGNSVNEVYLGIELIPLLKRDPNGTLYTDAQYKALGALIKDIAGRHGFEAKGARLVGHEDVNPIDRSNAGGGWDPSALRDAPNFLWELVK